MVALALMGFLVLLLVGLAALVQVETRREAAQLQLLEARQNALFGLKMAMAQLQQAAGPDQRVTARADILTTDAAGLGEGKRYWTGVWPTDSAAAEPEPVWLVSQGLQGASSAVNPRFGWSEDTRVIDVVRSSGEADTVQAESIPIMADSRESGRYAYWVGDEGIKAKVTLATAMDQQSTGNRYRQTTPWRFGIEQITGLEEIGLAMSGAGNSPQNLDLSALKRVTNFPQFQLLSPSIESAAGDLFHDLTTHSLGVISNSRSGGLRNDLTVRLGNEIPIAGNLWEPGDDFPNTGPTWELLRRYYRMVESTRDYAFDETPVLPLQRSHDASQLGSLNAATDPPYPSSPALQPILTWVGMTYGAFADHDISEDPEIVAYRLHLSMKPVVVLWNPYDVAIESDAGYVVNIVASNAASHHLAPLFRMENHYTDTGTTRNMHVAALLPDHHIFEKPYYASTGHNLRSEGPRFSIPPITLLPGEVAVFTLPSGTNDSYTHLTTNDVSEELFGSNPALAIGGPVLERGFRPEPYVWVPIHDGPIASSGNAAGAVRLPPQGWEGTRADMGRVEFNINGGPGQDEPLPVELYYASQAGGSDASIVPLPGEHTAAGLTQVGFSPGSSGRFNVHLHHGQLFFNRTIQTEANMNLGIRNKMLGAFATRKDGAQGFRREFATAGLFEQFFFNGPVDFSSWAIALSTPLLEEHHSAKILGHYNIRALHSGGLPSDWLEPVRLDGNSPLYIFINEGGEDIAPLDPLSGGEGESLFTAETVRTIDHGVDGSTEERFIGPILFHVPRHGLISLGQLMHLDMSRNIWNPTYVFGNSRSSPFIASTTISENHAGYTLYDQSYLANTALWDGYFFSTVQTFPSQPINTRLVYIDPEVTAAYDGNPELSAAATMLIDGPFNINSTSVEAWKSVLAALNFSTLTFSDLNLSDPDLTTQRMDSPFPRSTYQPLFGAIRNKEEDSETWELEFETWNSVPELTPEQIDALAKRIVFELRNQGRPFQSIAEFVNRNPNFAGTPPTGFGRNPRTTGILQRALDADYGSPSDQLDGTTLASTVINPRGGPVDQVNISAARVYNINYSDDETAQGVLAEGVPGYLMQSDILQAMAPLISARSDTFIIRAYGETSGGFAGTRSGGPAQALCEAVVQRVPTYIDETTPAEITPTPGSINELMGRRFRIVSFRWLSTDEI